MMDQLARKAKLAELLQQVESFLGLGTLTQANEAFLRHQSAVIASMQVADPELLEHYPEYQAIGFVGKFVFEECTLTDSLPNGCDEEKFLALRRGKSVQLKATSDQEMQTLQKCWQFLGSKYSETQRTVLVLCFQAQKSAKVKKLLNPAPTTKSRK